MTGDFKEKCKDFLDIFEQRRINEFNKENWYKNAFSTVARPLGKLKKDNGGYKKWYNEHYNILKCDILYMLDNNLTPIGLYEKLDTIACDNGVTFGIVQKIFSILLKYIICNYYAGNDSEKIKKEYPWVEDDNVLMELPVPIDSLVLNNLKDCSDLEIEVHMSAKVNGEPWSKMGKDVYKKLQNEIKRRAKGIIPLEYEMDELWK